MKYLKLFEDLSSLYTKIDSNEYYSIYEIEPSQDFIKKVKKWSDENNWQCYKPHNREHLVIAGRFKDTSILGSTTDKIRINIKEAEDEWYYISVRYPMEKYYKCDQLDGLIDFLNYIKSVDDIIKFIRL